MGNLSHYFKLIILFGLVSGYSLQELKPDYKVKKISESRPNDLKQLYRFPILTGGDSLISQKVNSFLTQRLLDLEYGQQQKSIFENVWGKEGSPASLYYLDYELLILNNSLYSVKISAEGCAAYCEYFEEYYTFDLVTGNHLELTDLLNQKGQKLLINDMINHKKVKMDEKIVEADSVLAIENLSEADLEYYTGMKDIYVGCSLEYISLEYLNYFISKDSLKIIIERCAPHAWRSMDELGEIHFSIALTDLKNSMNEQGRKVFN